MSINTNILHQQSKVSVDEPLRYRGTDVQMAA